MFRPLPTPQEVADHLQWNPADSAAQISPHLSSVTAMVRSYTRGAGFKQTTEGPFVQEDIAAVIVAATCRSANNPAQVTREEIGSWNSVPGKFEGYTLAEQFVLNNYRRRTA